MFCQGSFSTLPRSKGTSWSLPRGARREPHRDAGTSYGAPRARSARTQTWLMNLGVTAGTNRIGNVTLCELGLGACQEVTASCDFYCKPSITMWKCCWALFCGAGDQSWDLEIDQGPVPLFRDTWGKTAELFRGMKEGRPDKGSWEESLTLRKNKHLHRGNQAFTSLQDCFLASSVNSADCCLKEKSFP